MGKTSRSAGLDQALGMVDWSNAPALFFAPYVSSNMTVEPQALGVTGDAGLAIYQTLFDQAVAELLTLAGLGADTAACRGAECLISETQVRRHRPLVAGQRVRVTVQLIEHDRTGLHFYLELRDAKAGWLAASAELVALHVDRDSRQAVPIPPALLGNLAFLKAAHRDLRRPPALGRRLALAVARHGDTDAHDPSPALRGAMHH